MNSLAPDLRGDPRRALNLIRTRESKPVTIPVNTCPTCARRDQLMRDLAREVDRLAAENHALRTEREAAA